MCDDPVPSSSKIDICSQPRLPRFMKLRHDAGRQRWLLLGPERVLMPDAIAVEVLRRCDGARSVQNIASELAHLYDAPVERIVADMLELLQSLGEKGVVRW